MALGQAVTPKCHLLGSLTQATEGAAFADKTGQRKAGELRDVDESYLIKEMISKADYWRWIGNRLAHPAISIS